MLRLLSSLVIFFILVGLLFYRSINNLAGMVRVVDGDTLILNNQHIRLHAIDAPELDQTCIKDGKDWPCGRQAKDMLTDFTKGSVIHCTPHDQDRYGRIVATCFKQQENINQWLVQEGWAMAYRYYSNRYIGEALEAKIAKRGIWQGSFIEPYQYRKRVKQ